MPVFESQLTQHSARLNIKFKSQSVISIELGLMNEEEDYYWCSGSIRCYPRLFHIFQR